MSVQLRRTISLPLLTLYGLGTIIGAGIFVLVGQVAGKAGMYAPVAFLLASVIAGFTAFSYAELSSRFPRSAGEAVYVDEAFHWRPFSIAVGWSAASIGIISAATIANGAVGYLHFFIPLPEWLLLILLVSGLGLLAAWGIAQSATVAAITTLITILGLLLVIGVSGTHFESLPARLPELLPPMEMSVWLGIAAGAFIAFYAFIGFEDMVNLAEEVEAPEKNLPLAIVLALAITMLLYGGVSLVAVLAVPAAELAASEAPLALIVEQAGASSQVAIAAISIIAVLDGALIQMIKVSRVLYGMSSQGMAVAFLSEVHPVTRTPLKATAIVAALILALALALPLLTLAQLTSLVTLFLFALTNLSLLRMKLQKPDMEGGVSYPLWVPAIGFILSTGFILLQFI